MKTKTITVNATTCAGRGSAACTLNRAQALSVRGRAT